jgi:hypothetical protein
MKLGKEVDLLPNMTAEEKALLAQKEKEINIPEKRALDAAAEIPLPRRREMVLLHRFSCLGLLKISCIWAVASQGLVFPQVIWLFKSLKGEI